MQLKQIHDQEIHKRNPVLENLKTPEALSLADIHLPLN